MDKKFINQAMVCHCNETVEEIAKVIADTSRRYLYVVDEEDKIVGVISQFDLVSKVIAQAKDPKTVTIEEIMTKNPISVNSEESLEDTYTKMTQVGAFCLPVTENNKLVGVIDINTILETLEAEHES